MRRFVPGWKRLGRQLGLSRPIRICADDLVILCKQGEANDVLPNPREFMGKLKPAGNEEKTHFRKDPAGEFDLLGLRSADGATRLAKHLRFGSVSHAFAE
jgi:hypothetical protein